MMLLLFVEQQRMCCACGQDMAPPVPRMLLLPHDRSRQAVLRRLCSIHAWHLSLVLTPALS
jgi:hypothetical protein